MALNAASSVHVDEHAWRRGSETGRRADSTSQWLVRPTTAALRPEMEARGALTLKSLVRPAALPFGPQMPPDRASAVGRKGMTKTTWPAPPSWSASFRSIGGDCKTCDTGNECGTQNQSPQHVDSSSLLSMRECRRREARLTADEGSGSFLGKSPAKPTNNH
jgi:hypothetical protein